MVFLAPEDIMSLLHVGADELDCAGLKLTLREAYVMNSPGMLGLESRRLPDYKAVEANGNMISLGPGAYLVKYNEYVEIPNGYIGFAVQRSSLLRMGASLQTAVWDPGFRGRGSGLLIVYSPHGIILERNVQLAQLVLARLSRPTRRTYEGFYQGEE
jgi:dUTP pyrophosphatase